MKFDTIKEAAQAWVNEFDAVPHSVVDKLWNLKPCVDVVDITPPAINDRVYVYEPSESGVRYGQITGYEEEDDVYVIELDDETEVKLESDEFEVQRDGYLPMWGTLWSFSDSCDKWWLGENLQAVANCGFRIYESEDYEYLIGIDGAGYDFYESHWIPLYKVRGLQWHKEEEETCEEPSKVAESDEQSDYDEAAKNLITAMFDYARETCMTERDAFVELVSLGIDKVDFKNAGFGEYVQQFYDEESEEE